MKSKLSEHSKKPYTKPEVVHYGTIEALTNTTLSGTKPDGVVGSFTLAS